MGKSKIEWCDETVNFMTGCRNGCPWCYARRMANRLAAIDGTPYNRLAITGRDPFAPAVHADAYRRARERLARMRTPQRVFVSSMGDVGSAGDYCYTDRVDGRAYVDDHGSDTRRVQDLIVTLARTARQHTYLVLTKRPEALWGRAWPPNVHVGTSLSRADAAAYNRVLALGRVDAHHRWVSVEPLLDPAFDPAVLEAGDPAVRWVVIGGLSRGTGALPDGCVAAAQRLVAWTRAHGVPCFVKDNIPVPRGDRPRAYP